MNVRVRRLQGEHARLQFVFAGHERIRIVESIGRPPERYVIEYTVKGLVEEGGEIKERGLHRAEITLGPGYPREMPRCVMLTPVFHPNIDHLAVCTEDISSAGQKLDRTVIFIGEMISFQAYNLQSPRNGDAAKWAAEHLDQLPLENVDLVPHTLLDEGAEASIAVAAAAAVADVAAGAETVTFCRNCGAPQSGVCINGHSACGDCLVPCSNCKSEMCVLCSPARCQICGSYACDHCGMACASCGAWSCLSDVAKCLECSRYNCKACAIQCAHGNRSSVSLGAGA
jgi:ubiquitin-protein ligase